MNNLLFVDDEPLMRDLYASLADELGRDFQVTTVPCGTEALKFLQDRSVDIVFSDLDMPEMHGSDFLTTVERLYPETIRVVISGRADQLAVARCLMYGHRYFQKPLKTKQLVSLVSRITRLRTIIRSEKVKGIVGRSTLIPSPPETYLRLTELLQNTQVPIEDIAQVVRSDPGLTAKLLQVVNSASFGYGHLATVEDALQMAGVEIVRALMLGLQARSFAQKHLKSRQLFSDLWAHSIDTATRCREVARIEGLDSAAQATCFTVGLLHDIGKLILAAHNEKEYSALVASALREKVPIYKKELEVYQATHADIGAYLLGVWGLPDEIIHAVERHHNATREIETKFTPLLCVHVVQNLLPFSGRIPDLDKDFLAQRGFSARLNSWQDALVNN